MKIRIGVNLGALPATAFSRVIAKLETLHVDSLWLSEQLSTPALEPLTGLTYALARTDHLKVGTGLTILPGRNPVIFAKQLATLALLAPRRVLPIVGIAPFLRAEISAFPVGPHSRAAVFDEALQLIRRLLAEEQVTFDGQFFTVQGVGIGERPPYMLDIWLGGFSPPALRRAGRLGDGWLGGLITAKEAGPSIATINAAAHDAGRSIDPEHFGIMIQMAMTEPSPSQLAALRAYRPGVDPTALLPVGWNAVRRAISDYADQGLSKFVIYPAVTESTVDEFLDGFARELMPMQT
jgi:probable F420-dependent oxidoreductase